MEKKIFETRVICWKYLYGNARRFLGGKNEEKPNDTRMNYVYCTDSYYRNYS